MNLFALCIMQGPPHNVCGRRARTSFLVERRRAARTIRPLAERRGRRELRRVRCQVQSVREETPLQKLWPTFLLKVNIFNALPLPSAVIKCVCLQVQQIRVGNLKTAHFEASEGVPGMPRHSALQFGRL